MKRNDKFKDVRIVLQTCPYFKTEQNCSIYLSLLCESWCRQRACEQFFFFFYKEGPSPPQSVILPPALPPPFPPLHHLLPSFLLQRMRGIWSFISLCIHSLLSFCLLPSPAISHIFCALGVFLCSCLALSLVIPSSQSEPILGLESVFNQSAECTECQPSHSFWS